MKTLYPALRKVGIAALILFVIFCGVMSEAHGESYDYAIDDANSSLIWVTLNVTAGTNISLTINNATGTYAPNPDVVFLTYENGSRAINGSKWTNASTVAVNAGYVNISGASGKLISVANWPIESGLIFESNFISGGGADKYCHIELGTTNTIVSSTPPPAGQNGSVYFTDTGAANLNSLYINSRAGNLTTDNGGWKNVGFPVTTLYPISLWVRGQFTTGYRNTGSTGYNMSGQTFSGSYYVKLGSQNAFCAFDWLRLRKKFSTEPNVSCVANVCTISGSVNVTDYQFALATTLTGNLNVSNDSIAPANSTWTVIVKNRFNDSPLAGANVSLLDLGGPQLTDANGSVTFSSNSTGVQWCKVDKTGYSLLDYGDCGSVSENGTGTRYLYQAVASNVSIFELVGPGVVSPPFNISVPGGQNYTLTGALLNLWLRTGQNNLTFTKTGYYPLSFTVNVSLGENITANGTGAYNAFLNITARDVQLNTSVNTFNVTVNNTAYSYTTSGSTTNGSRLIPIIKGLDYFLFMDATGYAYTNASVQNVSNTTTKYRFDLYTENSVFVNIYDEATGSPIYQNMTILVLGDNLSTTNYTTTATFFIDGLLAGNYSFRILNANYTMKTYAVTVGGRSTQTLNAYLSPSTSTTIFFYQDADTSSTLEGVGATMYRLIDGTWTVTDVKTSDITGRAQFSYTPGVKYKFVQSMTGYETKIFYLDPILFSTYTIKLSRSITLSNASDYTGVNTIYQPQIYTSGDIGTLNYLVSSPVGSLTGYGVTLSYMGFNSTQTGSNANGGQLNISYNLTGATAHDFVNITYWYNSTLSGRRTFTASYRVIGVYSTTSIEALKAGRFGLGLIETVLVSVLIIGVMAGIATMVAGALAGGALALILFGFFIYIGFIPIWAAVISFLVGFLILVRRSD